MMRNNTTDYKDLVRESLSRQENNISALEGYIEENKLDQKPAFQEVLDILTSMRGIRTRLEKEAASNITTSDIARINGAISGFDIAIDIMQKNAESFVNTRRAFEYIVESTPKLAGLSLAEIEKMSEQLEQQSKPKIQRLLDTISKVFNQVVSAIKGLFQKAELPNPRAGGAGAPPSSSVEFNPGGASAANQGHSVKGGHEHENANTTGRGGPK